MEKTFEIVFKDGPFGDQMCSYDIRIHNEHSTVADLIHFALSRLDDWGEIFVNNNYVLKYRYGVIEHDDIPETTKCMFLNDVWARGGWSAMDYFVSLK